MLDRVWIVADEKRQLTEALELGYATFVAADPTRLQGLARARILRLDERGLHEGDALLAPRVEIRTPDDQARALALAGHHGAVFADAKDWKIIPHENLIAAYRLKGTKLVAAARDADDARLLLETLESGVDVVLLPAAHARELAAKLASLTGHERLVEARVTGVRAVGMGDRACLDTATLLREDEGVLTGNASRALFLVASEARESGYVAGRPFRVNAGAVHAYVLLPGGRTRYLSELASGDEVLAVGRDGAARSVVLGRVKIERRPLLLVEAETPNGPASALLQNAETIRLVGPQGTKSVVDLAPGDVVLVRLDEGGRHFGMRVQETVTER